MIIEPAQQNLLRRESEELVQRLVVFQQPVQFRVQLDINLSKQTAADNLPDQPEEQVLANLNDILAANVDYRATNTFCRVDNNVVVLGHVERIQLLDLRARLVQNPLINCVGNTVVNQFRQDQPVLALIEHFEGIRGEGKHMANIGVARQNGVDMSREFGTLIFVNCMGDIGT